MIRLSQVAKPWLIIAGVVLVLLLGLFDTLSGIELSFSVFYMLPIYLVTWHVGRLPGVAISIISALTWLLADYAAGQAPSHSLIPIWNMAVRLTFFLLMTYLLSELQKADQRRRSLERIFFHDILNLLGSVRGFAELLKEEDIPATKEVYELIYQAADRSLIDIEAQRTLASAENDELVVMPTETNSLLLMKLIVNLYRHHEVAKARTIEISEDSEIVEFTSDQSILSRILGNMLKNALEASPSGGCVSFGCYRDKDVVCFTVHNQAVVPAAVRNQIFKQVISTKGKGRGVGTYSMKLLTEYLQGEVSFTSSEQKGTTFKACYPLAYQMGKDH